MSKRNKISPMSSAELLEVGESLKASRVSSKVRKTSSKVSDSSLKVSRASSRVPLIIPSKAPSIVPSKRSKESWTANTARGYPNATGSRTAVTWRSSNISQASLQALATDAKNRSVSRLDGSSSRTGRFSRADLNAYLKSPASSTGTKDSSLKKPTPEEGQQDLALWQLALGMVLLSAIMVAYVNFGAGSILIIEQTGDRVVQSPKMERTAKRIVSLTKTTTDQQELETKVSEALREFQKDVLDKSKSGWKDGMENTTVRDKWNFQSSVLFCASLVTTVGYGIIAPATVKGRVFTILYSLVGVPLALVCISIIGVILARFFRGLVSFVRLVKRDKNDGKIYVPLWMSLLVMLTYLSVGAYLFSVLEEDWTYEMAFYFCFITLSTIGLGDLVYGHDKKDVQSGGYIASVVYLLVGLSLVSMCFTLMQEEVAHKLRILFDCMKRTLSALLRSVIRFCRCCFRKKGKGGKSSRGRGEKSSRSDRERETGKSTGTERDVEKGTKDTEKRTKDSEKETKDSEKETKDSEKGTKDSEKGTKDTDKGTKDTDKGTKDTHQGTKDTEKGTKDTDKGTTDTEKGTKDTDKGTKDTDKGAKDTDKGTKDTDKGTKDTDKGTKVTDKGAKDTEKGPKIPNS